MRQQKWVDFLKDYKCEIHYHLDKANTIVDSLSWNEHVKIRQVWALTMSIHFNLSMQIREAQFEALKEMNIESEDLRGMGN